ncbi:hypothetical protein E3N88_30050 [Mikania micrantha]|uniref:Uncharacterized protein n=1 Tax=Mikania micrantha TaxID=192012 RepID=A0A5N6MMN2_9ASTR|nr:hypothetical protein E3N88_30050 [Mikania micrantha]
MQWRLERSQAVTGERQAPRTTTTVVKMQFSDYDDSEHLKTSTRDHAYIQASTSYGSYKSELAGNNRLDFWMLL